MPLLLIQGVLTWSPTICLIVVQGVSKKTEFCQIEHLQILLVFGEKYLIKIVANPVVSCFEMEISMLLFILKMNNDEILKKSFLDRVFKYEKGQKRAFSENVWPFSE